MPRGQDRKDLDSSGVAAQEQAEVGGDVHATENLATAAHAGSKLVGSVDEAGIERQQSSNGTLLRLQLTATDRAAGAHVAQGRPRVDRGRQQRTLQVEELLVNATCLEVR